MPDGDDPSELGSRPVRARGNGPPGALRRRRAVAILGVRAPQLCGRVADKSGPYRVSPERIASTPEAESDWTRPPPRADVPRVGLCSASSDLMAAMTMCPPDWLRMLSEGDRTSIGHAQVGGDLGARFAVACWPCAVDLPGLRRRPSCAQSNPAPPPRECLFSVVSVTAVPDFFLPWWPASSAARGWFDARAPANT
jgi:hypothetical protein